MPKSDFKLGNLNKLKSKLRKRFPQITEVDLSSLSENENVMISLVAYKLRKTKAEILEIVKGL